MTTTDLGWARMQRALIFHARGTAEAPKRWRFYQAWLAERGYVEVWEPAPDGGHALARLKSTAGKSWGGA